MAKTSQRVARRGQVQDPRVHPLPQCGRPRAVYRKFGLCRICLRELAHNGYIPGMTKSQLVAAMSMTDPIADFLTRIRNGIQAAHETVDIPASKLKVEMARILREQGYINGYEVEAPNADHPGEILRVTLKYTDDRRSAISGLRRVSRPGQRRYVPASRHPEGAGRHGHRDRVDVATAS